jgi:sugar lactone lactonase YvrE
MCCTIIITAKFMANGIRWSPNGRTLLLVDKDMIMMVHLDDQLFTTTAITTN